MAKRDPRELVKAEPSRSEAMTPAATSHPHYGSHRLRQLATSGLGEAGAMQAAVTRMMRTEPEDPRTRPTPHVVDLADVTRGLGLEQSDESRVQQLVGSSIPAFTQKTQTQRIMHARGRLTSTMRDALKHVDADKRDEVTRRAMAYWRRNYQTDYGKEPTVRYQGARAVEKSMPAPIPVLPLANLYDRLADAKSGVLEKGEARGGKYYRRIPTGNPKRPWRYFYHESEYQQYLREQHKDGAEAAAARVHVEPPVARPKPAQQQLGFDFGPAAPKPEPAPAKPTEPAIIPLWLENRRRDALAAIEAGNAHRMKVMLDGTETVSAALEGPGAPRGRKWLLEHVITPLTEALAKLDGPKLVVPTHGRPHPEPKGLEVTGVPPTPATSAPAAATSSAFRSPAGTTERAVEHAEKLAELLRAKGLKYVNVWSKPGVGTRVYLPARQYLAIGQDGSVSTVVNGRQTYDPGALWPQHRSVVDEARAEHRTWHGERLAAQDAERAAPAPEAEAPKPPAPEAPAVVRPEPESIVNQPPPKLVVPVPSPAPAPSSSGEVKQVLPEPVVREGTSSEVRAHLDKIHAAIERVLVRGANAKTDPYEYVAAVRALEAAQVDVEKMPVEQRKQFVVHLRQIMLPALKGVADGAWASDVKGAAASYTNLVWTAARRIQANAEAAAGPPPTPTVPTSVAKAPEGSPRAEAAKKAVAEGAYVNDRSSKVEQRGEDVGGSARHKAAEWKSLREALGSDQAEAMFTRDFLIRQEPIDFVSRVQKAKAAELGVPQQMTVALNTLAAHLALRKFGAKPEFAWRSGYGYYYEGPKLTRGWTSTGEEVSGEEHTKRQRESYYRAFGAARAALEQYADRSESPSVADLGRTIRRVYDEHVAKYGSLDAGTEALRSMYNGIVGRGQLSVSGQLNEFAHRVKKAHGSLEAGAEHVPEHVMRLLEGASMNAAFGEKAEKKGYAVDLASMYDTSNMTRSGPPSEYRGVKQALDLLDKHAGGKLGMRGVQWGKSVTDEEREHHLKSLVDSFNDLTDILGLPPGMASYNGKLAIAVGARGKAGALAHYEPTTDVINLTRSSGAGSLAHEWAHFFDFAVGGVEARENGRGSKNPDTMALTSYGAVEETPGSVRAAMTSLRSSPAWEAFRSRVREVCYAKKMSAKERGYWTSGVEVWARVVERHVQRKLHKTGRENTYLVALRKAASDPSGLWPTDEEVEKMAPAIEAVFDAFRASTLLHKAMGLPLAVAPEYRSIVGGRLVVTRG